MSLQSLGVTFLQLHLNFPQLESPWKFPRRAMVPFCPQEPAKVKHWPQRGAGAMGRPRKNQPAERGILPLCGSRKDA